MCKNMSIIEQRNKEAQLIWDILYGCEVYALWHDKDEEQKKKFLERKLKGIPKSKKYARASIKKVISSGNISEYVNAISERMQSLKPQD